ncbi:hypothetical protein E2C01_022085 [Portunus trituberculatus]|uniref:Uncharacterized protein n=1 Tax=Portunus trituberculatus TaxID=210409 RepID=A0A5B7E4A8_PORTR|nr:hypothetical protein [Portunus trituberculatus]
MGAAVEGKSGAKAHATSHAPLRYSAQPRLLLDCCSLLLLTRALPRPQCLLICYNLTVVMFRVSHKQIRGRKIEINHLTERSTSAHDLSVYSLKTFKYRWSPLMACTKY